jgi:nitrite reductase/ring-hydroxylating ferredoxin subunit
MNPEIPTQTDSQGFYATAIPLQELQENHINKRTLTGEVEVIILKKGGHIQIFEEICPHMGGPLSAGCYNTRENRLQCPWHGYWFDLTTGLFQENPNEAIWEKLRYSTQYYKPGKTPKYKLNQFAYEIRQNMIYIYRKGSHP